MQKTVDAVLRFYAFTDFHYQLVALSLALRYTGCVEETNFQSEDDTSRHDATGPGVTRPVAAELDGYISLKEALEIFREHNRPVSERTLQRACVKGHISGKKSQRLKE